MGSWPRGRSCSRGTRRSRRVSTPSPSPRSTPPPSGCSPSTRGGRTQEATATARSCTRLEPNWKEKFAEFSKRPAKKLPKWFGVRPGKKAGDPETPEGEEEAAAEEAAEEEYEEEEEDYEEEEEEEE